MAHRLADLRPRHCEVKGCPCKRYQWDGRPADPAERCTCSHRTSHHSFITRDRPEDFRKTGPNG